MTRTSSLRAGAAVIAIACATPSFAQNLQQATLDNPNEVLARPRPGYDATGVKVGGFTVMPYATADLAYDDNIYASDIYKRADEEALIAAGADIQSNWSRHALGFSLRGATEQFAHETSQNNQTVDLQGRGTLDVRRGVAVDLSTRYAHLTELRGSLGDVFIGGTPSQYDLKSVYGDVRLAPGNFTITGGAGVDDYQYDSIRFQGNRYDQGYRNFHELNANGRIAYAVSPAVSPYVDYTHNSVYYPHRGDAGLNFNSHGDEVIGGVKVALSRLVVGEFGIGYVHQAFADRRFTSVSGLAYRGKIVWNPTTLMTFTLSGDTTVGQSGIIGVGGVLQRQVEGRVDYELLRNLLLHGFVDTKSYDYHGIDRTDHYVGGGAGARYLMNQHVSFDLNYSHSHQNSRGDFARIFSDNRLALTIRLQR